MKKRIFIIHGWDGYPEENWFPWLKKELEARSFEVFVPQLPKADEPRISNWVPKLRQFIEMPDKNTYFVGHSMGCQAIARYLESLPKEIKIGGVVFVAGFFKRLTNLEDDDIVRSVSEEWLKTPLDMMTVKSHIKKSVAIFSDDDPYVPLDNKDDFADIFGSNIIIEKNKGHFNKSANVTELPSVLQAVLDFN